MHRHVAAAVALRAPAQAFFCFSGLDTPPPGGGGCLPAFFEVLGAVEIRATDAEGQEGAGI